MAATAQLIQDARCIDSCVPPGMRQSIIIYLLAQIAGVSADPQTLVTNAQCVDHCVPAGMRASVIANLLNTIEENGGAGGSGSVLCSANSDPVAAPAGDCGIFYRLDVGQVWLWNAGTASWNLILG